MEKKEETEERRISRVCSSAEYRKLETKYEKAKMLLDKAKCSKSAAARKLDLTRGTVTRWMNGTRGNRGTGRPGYLMAADKERLVQTIEAAIKDHKPLDSDEILSTVEFFAPPPPIVYNSCS
jgi:hypothetical protein